MKSAEMSAWLLAAERLAVAFSGGVDSTLLAAMARRTLGRDRVLLLLADSVLLPRREWTAARELAARLDAPLQIVTLAPLDRPEVRDNSARRCYHCKKHLMSCLQHLARERGFPLLADGTNLDDLGDDRPGLQACDELGVRHPFLECRIDKAAIRQLARSYDLPNSAWPAAACLASRIPTGTALTTADLAAVEAGEDYLIQCGFTGARVRKIGREARLELRSDADFQRAAALRHPLLSHLQTLGFQTAVLDLAGYRTGAMNRVNAPPESPAD